MEVIENIAEMQRVRRQLREPVGFVPTMGYLHEGHLSLVRQARQENATVVASIFVNPTQFGPGEDFERYPRDTARDLAMLEKEMTDVVFMPSAAGMYPPGFCTWVKMEGITDRLEGAARPGHFHGVTTVVAKLFNIVRPARAYFGQKDAQQLLVIRKMVADLNMDLGIVAMTTVRETDGLAMSSRNSYLSEDHRRAAVILHRALGMAQTLWLRGERDARTLRREMTALIEKEPVAVIEYISVADVETLEELKTVTGPALVSLAVNFGGTRLIDNFILE
jgi:pantoate--beta-alanine ligase